MCAERPISTVRIHVQGDVRPDDPFWAALMTELGAVGTPARDGTMLVALPAPKSHAVDVVCEAIALVDHVDRDRYEVFLLPAHQG